MAKETAYMFSITQPFFFCIIWQRCSASHSQAITSGGFWKCQNLCYLPQCRHTEKT